VAHVPAFIRGPGIAVAVVCVAIVVSTWRVDAAELEARTLAAYEVYRARVTEAFVGRGPRDWGTMAPEAGVIEAGPGEGDGITDLPGGLVHHWRGIGFIRGATLQDVVAHAQRYEEYPRFYEAVKAVRLLEHDGNTFRTVTRIETGAGGVHGVLDLHGYTEYSTPLPGVVLAVSASEEIREVKDAGTPEERLLPEGDDSGFLWRAASLTRFTQLEGGVGIERETLGLSRRFPRLMGWLVEPFVRRLGKKSVQESLREFVDAVGAGAAAPLQ
jgi:hypothetical protein